MFYLKTHCRPSGWKSPLHFSTADGNSWDAGGLVFARKLGAVATIWCKFDLPKGTNRAILQSGFISHTNKTTPPLRLLDYIGVFPFKKGFWHLSSLLHPTTLCLCPPLRRPPTFFLRTAPGPGGPRCSAHEDSANRSCCERRGRALHGPLWLTWRVLWAFEKLRHL